MKTKTLIIIQTILIVVLLVLVIKYCNFNKCCTTSTINDSDAIDFIENSRHTLDKNKVTDLYENYKKRFLPVIENIQKNVTDDNGVTIIERPEYLPTEYSIVSLQKLKNYIAFLDVLQKKNPEQTISGIAISFGAYNINKKTESRSRGNAIDPIQIGDYRGRMTTYFTPTYYDTCVESEYDAAKHIPFYIKPDNESDKYKGTYKSLYYLLDSEKYKKTITCDRVKRQTNQASMLGVINFSSMINLAKDATIVSFNDYADMPPDTK